MQTLAQSLGVESGQTAIAWRLQQASDIVPIPGTKRVKYMEENIAAAAISLDAALAPGKTSGPRYNSSMMSMVDW